MPPEPKKSYYTFMIDADLAAGLKRLKARDGIPEGEQIRRALRAWLQSKQIRLSASAAIRKGGRKR